MKTVSTSMYGVPLIWDDLFGAKLMLFDGLIPLVNDLFGVKSMMLNEVRWEFCEGHV